MRPAVRMPISIAASRNQVPRIKGDSGGCKKLTKKRKILHGNAILEQTTKNLKKVCFKKYYTPFYYRIATILSLAVNSFALDLAMGRNKLVGTGTL